MPEGPEVSASCRILTEDLQGCVLQSLSVASNFRGARGLDIIQAQALRSVQPLGKRLIWLFDTFAFFVFLAMHGHFVYKRERHTVMELVFFKPIGSRLRVQKIVYFDDMLRHGTFEVCTQHRLSELATRIGPDLLNGSVDLALYTRILRSVKQTMPVAAFMIEQKYLSGIGNYARAEILYECGLHPMRQLQSLRSDDVQKLWRVSREVLAASLAAGGLTIATYHDPRGGLGTYVAKIYGQPWAHKLTLDKRTVHFDPTRQF